MTEFASAFKYQHPISIAPPFNVFICIGKATQPFRLKAEWYENEQEILKCSIFTNCPVKIILTIA